MRRQRSRERIDYDIDDKGATFAGECGLEPLCRVDASVTGASHSTNASFRSFAIGLTLSILFPLAPRLLVQYRSA
jgi:hypothetical protein